MLENPEERKRKRQQDKARRQAAQRNLIIRLIIAAAVLVLCGIVILVIALGIGFKKDPEPTSPPVATQPAENVQSEESQSDTTVIHFAATGDLNITQRVVASGGANYDFSGAFLDVAPVLSSADLTTVNLEGDLAGAPYGSNGTAPQTMVQTLRRAGVDMIQLANSYAVNRGVSGLMTTIDSVRQAGMEPVGVFKDEAEFQDKQGFSLFEVQGVRIAVVAFTKGMARSTGLPPGNENCVNTLYSDYNSTYQDIDKEKIDEIMKAVEKQEPDITIALLHWGSEWNDSISKSQDAICELLQEYGTDAIIGTHPHYLHKIDYNSENGTLVAYSLGDFIGDAPEAGTEYSIILDMEITKDNTTGEASVTGYSYTPIFTVTEKDKPVKVVRIREAIAAYESGYMEAVSQETYEAMKYALTRIEQRIAGE